MCKWTLIGFFKTHSETPYVDALKSECNIPNDSNPDETLTIQTNVLVCSIFGDVKQERYLEKKSHYYLPVVSKIGLKSINNDVIWSQIEIFLKRTLMARI